MKTLRLPDLQVASARQFNYYVIPKMLISDPVFAEVSVQAKLIYALMLNRAALSAGHPDKFTDEQGRFFIIYTIDELTRQMQLSKPTCVKMVQQLCEAGLIEKKRRGQGKPSLIYLKDFSAAVQEAPDGNDPDDELPDPEGGKSTDEKRKGREDAGEDLLESKGADSRSQKNLLLEVKAENRGDSGSNTVTSRSKKFFLQEVKKFDRRKNDKRKNEKKKLLPSLPPPSGERKEGEKEQVSLWDNLSPAPAWQQLLPSDREELEENIRDQLEFPVLAERYGEEEAREVVRLVADTLTRRGGEMTIGGGRYPLETVRDRFRQLTFEQVANVMDRLDTLADVRNPHAYLRAMLFNAPACCELTQRGLFQRSV